MITPSFSPTATERVLPKLALDFTTASLDPRVTFTRTTGASNPATYTNSNGVITAATDNQPRFDYDPITLACKGLLIEESRANLLLRSSEFNETAWVKNGSTITTDAITSPDNTLSADKIVETAVSGWHGVRQVASTGTVGVFSFFAKAAERSRVWVAGDNPDWAAAVATFNLSNGTVQSGTGTITNFGNGWYRCSVSVTVSARGCTIVSATDTGSVFHTGDGVSGIYIWGAQLETGAFATSYIPTTTTALTRNADVAVMTGTNFSSWFNATEGALTVWFDTNATGQGGVFSINNGSSTQRIDYRSGAASGFVFINGNSAMFLGSPTKGVLRKACVAIKNASFAGQVTNGTFRTASDAIPTGLSTLNIGSLDSAANFVNGHISKIFYFPQRLVNAEVQAQVRI